MYDLQLRRFSLDVALTFARQFLAGLLKLCIILLIANALGPKGAGSWSVAQLLPNTLGQLLNLGLVSASVYFVASKKFELEYVWAVSRDMTVALAAIGSLVGVAVVSMAGETIFPGVDLSLLLVAVGIFPLTLLNGVVAGLFQARQDFRHYNILALAEPTVTLTLIAMLWVTTGLTLISALLAAVVGYGATLLLGLVFLSGNLRLWAPATRSHLEYLRPALRYGVFSHLGNLVSFLNYRLDIYLVNLFLGPAATGIYTVAVRLGEQVWVVSQAVSTVIFPRLSAMRSAASLRNELTVVVSRATLWASAIVGAALLIVSEPLIAVLFGIEFQAASWVLALLLPGIVVLSGARVLANDLAARNMVAANFYISLGLLVANVVGTLLLIPPFGLAGAAISTSVAYGLHMGTLLVVRHRLTRDAWWHTIVPQLSDVQALLALAQKLARRAL